MRHLLAEALVLALAIVWLVFEAIVMLWPLWVILCLVWTTAAVFS